MHNDYFSEIIKESHDDDGRLRRSFCMAIRPVVKILIEGWGGLKFLWCGLSIRFLPLINRTPFIMRPFLIFILCLVSLLSSAQQSDWPMWRYDYGRTACTPEQLPDRLYLQWQAEYGERLPVWDDPLNQNLMQYDRLLEPIVADGKIFLGFNDLDKVVALDIHSGEELWRFYADGPVRLPLAFYHGNLYFTGDDGYCYCLNAADGSLVWKIALAPAPEKLLGNKRMISMWPARGGIVIKDDILYTAASIFPMMGTFIYAIDTQTGQMIWKNEETGSEYILQPHRSPAYAGVAPQGAFTISGDRLLVSGGRTVPAAFDLHSGRKLYYHLAESGKTGGAWICANDHIYFNHHRERMTWMYDSETGKVLAKNAGNYPVIDGNIFYFSGDSVAASQLDASGEPQRLWDAAVPANHDLIKAGDSFYAAGEGGITAFRISPEGVSKFWSFPTDRSVERLVAANGKLIAVTGDGNILVFGNAPVRDTPDIRSPEIPFPRPFNPC